MRRNRNVMLCWHGKLKPREISDANMRLCEIRKVIIGLARRIRCVGHIASMEEIKACRFWSKNEEETPFGRPRLDLRIILKQILKQ
jgi:hypothetical protein